MHVTHVDRLRGLRYVDCGVPATYNYLLCKNSARALRRLHYTLLRRPQPAAVDGRSSQKIGANRALLCDPMKIFVIVYKNRFREFVKSWILNLLLQLI